MNPPAETTNFPRCPRCGHPEYSQDYATDDGRPRFTCSDCGHAWTAGKSGGVYLRLPGPVLLACGSRNWTDRGTVRRELRLIQPRLVIHGANGTYKEGRLIRGADMMADEEAKRMGIPTDPHPYIKQLGRAGGPVRNREMLARNPDLVVAFTDDDLTNGGTADMVGRARKKGTPVRVVNSTKRKA